MDTVLEYMMRRQRPDDTTGVAMSAFSDVQNISAFDMVKALTLLSRAPRPPSQKVANYATKAMSKYRDLVKAPWDQMDKVCVRQSAKF